MTIPSFIFCLSLINLGMPGAYVACSEADSVLEESEKNNMPPEVLFALIYYESRWQPKARSSAAACGLTQVIPRWTKDITGKRYSCKQLKVPATSIKVGAKILGYHYERSNNNIKQALCMYNQGPRYCRGWYAKTRGTRYARKILKFSVKIRERSEGILQCRQEEECCFDPYIPNQSEL